MFKLFKYSLAVLLSVKLAYAEPYINTSDLALRTSISNLASQGLIKTPINTYPLMWADIAHEIDNIDITKLADRELENYIYITSQLLKAPRKKLSLQLKTANRDKRFTSFGDNSRNKNSLTVSASQVMDHFAYKVSPSFNSNSIDGDEIQLNDTYVAARLANWNISLGTQNRWWGPGWDTNVALTNNARPMVSAAITRNIARPFKVPFTEHYQIPWNVTSFIGQMEADRFVPKTLLWGFRLNFNPIENLELSLVRLAQWGGTGRSQSFSTFIDVLVGLDNCGASGLNCGENKENEPGNQQAGYDFKYSFQLFNTPMSIYGQYFGEDGDASGGLNFVTEPATQLGFDTQLFLFGQNLTFFTEYTDTFQSCGGDPRVGNCFYEHHIYQTGMRYKQRNIGNLFDNDARSQVLGILGNNNQGMQWHIKLRYVKLNIDNSDRYPNLANGNTVTEKAEKLWMLSANYQQKVKQVIYKLGTDLSRSTFINDETNNQLSFSAELLYTF